MKSTYASAQKVLPLEGLFSQPKLLVCFRSQKDIQWIILAVCHFGWNICELLTHNYEKIFDIGNTKCR